MSNGKIGIVHASVAAAAALAIGVGVSHAGEGIIGNHMNLIIERVDDDFTPGSRTSSSSTCISRTRPASRE